MELKPCPFCGESGKEIRDYTYYIPGNIYIGIFYCCNCGGAMIDTDKSHCWLDRAKLWNKRLATSCKLQASKKSVENQRFRRKTCTKLATEASNGQVI